MTTKPEKSPRVRLDRLFGERRRYLVVCDGGLYLREEEQGGSDEEPFVAVTRLTEGEAVRAAEFHPSGRFYVVGSNNKMLTLCAYTEAEAMRPSGVCRSPAVLQRHRVVCSPNCVAWNATGDLLATGSDDKSVRLLKFDAETCSLEDAAPELRFRGAVRDACFMEDRCGSRRSNLLISGGEGDHRIHVTDCETATPFHALAGHTGPILCLYTWGGAEFVSSSRDRTVRLWDMRSLECVQLVTTANGSSGGSTTCISADLTGRLLVSGQDDGSCTLYDVRGGRVLQTFRPHTSAMTSVRFSSGALYLLTASHDRSLAITDLRGELTQPLTSVRVAHHADKVLRGRWHPRGFTFLSTSSDGTAVLWAVPP